MELSCIRRNDSNRIEIIVSRVQYVYDQNGWLSEIKVNGHASREYDYDSFGRIIQMTDHAVSGNAEIHRSYIYGQYSRVTSMEYTTARKGRKKKNRMNLRLKRLRLLEFFVAGMAGYD